MKKLVKDRLKFLALAERVHEILQRRHWEIRWNGGGWTVDAKWSATRMSNYAKFWTFLSEMQNPCPFEAVDAAETWLMFAEGYDLGTKGEA